MDDTGTLYHDSVRLTDEITSRIVDAMRKTWDACGMDFMQLMVEYENRSYCTREEVAECVVDANRMETYGDDKEATDQYYDIEFSESGKQEKERIIMLAFPESRHGG